MSDRAPIRYRPHHFLCSLGFEGKGYSEAFTANMTAIVMGQLRAQGGYSTPIQVVTQADDICAPCPKLRGAHCSDQGNISRLDAAHAKALELRDGEILSWGEALGRICRNVKPGDLSRVCAGCTWLEYGMCEAALLRLHDSLNKKTAP